MLQEQEMPDVIPPVLRHRRFAERQLEPRAVQDVAVVDEDALGRLRPEVRNVLVGLNRSRMRFVHQVE